MPSVQNLVARSQALQYDGTNSSAVLSFINAGGWVVNWTKLSETGGVLTLHNTNSAWDNIVLNTGDYMLSPTCQTASPDLLAFQFFGIDTIPLV